MTARNRAVLTASQDHGGIQEASRRGSRQFARGESLLDCITALLQSSRYYRKISPLMMHWTSITSVTKSSLHTGPG